MKKILFVLAATFCSLVACDPVQEDFSIGGHITAEELVAKSSVTVDKDANGMNGNVVTCTTSAPVNAKWTIDGKDFKGNSAWKKMKLGEYTVTLTGLCADGTVVTADFPIKCEVITNQLERYYIYGHPEAENPNHHLVGFEGDPFSPGGWDAAQMRFSDNEGKHFPYLSDDVYWGFKTLCFEITDASDDCKTAIMTGWWGAWYNENGGKADDRVDVPLKNGVWELPLTEDIAKFCARGNGGSGQDLQLMLTSGSCTFNNVYYEE